MKLYRGHPGGFVTVSYDDQSPRSLHGGDVQPGFDWGSQTPACAHLARALLIDMIGEGEKVHKYYRRFMHRCNSAGVWAQNSPFTVNEGDLLEILDSIETIEKDSAGDRARMSSERPKVQVDRTAPGQVWTKEPNIVPNKPKE
jgi:hypothetical protein